MTREIIKELLPIFHAFAEGKTIQCCDKDKHYRPFKNCDELRNNYRYDSIWVKSKYDSNVQLMITGYTINDEGVLCVWLTDSWISLEKLFDDWVFVNDISCGVEE